MTREEEIKKAATKYADEFASENSAQYVDAVHGFISGAKWTDEHPKSPWISVEERLPKCVHTTTDGGSFSDMCLCMTKAGEYIPLALNEVCEDDEGLSYYWGTYNDVYDEEVNGEITHWQPILPLND